MYLIMFLIGATFCYVLPVFSEEKSVQAPSSSDELTPLTDDVSRAELFKMVIQAAEKENPTPPDIQKSLEQSGPFKFPVNALTDGDKPREKSIFGIDISHYTGRNFEFDGLKDQQVRFVYAKATQGLTYKDDLFAGFWSAMDALPADKKVLRGAYHFLSSSGDGAAQADTFLTFVDKNGGFKSTDMPPVVDLEWDVTQSNRTDRWTGHSPDQIIDTTLAWLKRVEEKTGRVPAIYTARAWWRERKIPEASFEKLSHYKIWIADYSRSARATEAPVMINKSAWHLWQFSETARLSKGFDGALDANIYKGSDDQFATDFQIAKN